VAQTDTLHIFAMVDQKDAALGFNEKPWRVQVRPASARGTVIKTGIEILLWAPGGSRDIKYAGLTQSAGEEAMPDPNDKSGTKIAIPQFPVVFSLPNPDHRLYPGQRAYVRLDMQKQPLIQQWARRFWQLVQSHSANNKWL
jgi:hypothetical protein